MSLAGSPLNDWLTRLEKLSPVAIELGLDRVRTVLDRLGPLRPECVLHVAGTNGKGSSVAMLQALLMASGVRTGSYTSPHVSRYNERICIDGREATDAQIIAAFERIEALRGDVPLTYFEFSTLAALVVFAEAKIDTAILEVGLGGRLDAVNVVEPDAGLITNVSLDHCDWLGNDVETIAFEKAGIMRGGKPIVFGSPEVPKSVLGHAESIGAQLSLAGRDFDWSLTDDGWTWRGCKHDLAGLDIPSLRGEMQLANAAGVLALLEACGLHDLLCKDTVNEAFGRLRLIGRMQSIVADTNWLLDVAHNPAAAAVLAETLRSDAIEGQTIAITAMLADKDVDGVIAPLAAVVDRWIAVTAASPRAIPAADLARHIANQSDRACLVAESVQQAIEFAREVATARDRILVTGSFYIVGPALEFLDSLPASE